MPATDVSKIMECTDGEACLQVGASKPQAAAAIGALASTQAGVQPYHASMQLPKLDTSASNQSELTIKLRTLPACASQKVVQARVMR